jgi:hypothetical protein
MPGLVPGIHVFLALKTWMAGTSPAMTQNNEANVYFLLHHLRHRFAAG